MKCIIKRSVLSHDTKVTEKNTIILATEERTRKPKARYFFTIKGYSGHKWYNRNIDNYTDEKSTERDESEMALKQVCEDIKSQCKKTVKASLAADKLPREKTSAQKKMMDTYNCKNRDVINGSKDESDQIHCKKGMYFHGVKCAGCKIVFGTKPNPPSRLAPIWVCSQQIRRGCTHSLCGVYYCKK